MRNFLVVSLFAATLFSLCHAQSASTLMGARVHGLANASACLPDEWSLFNNVAGLAKIRKYTASASYEVSPWSAAFNKAAAVINIPGKVGAAIGFFRFGDSAYQEQLISIGAGTELGITALGIKVNYIRYSIQGFGDRSVISTSFGGITELTPRLSVGAHITNINQAYLSKTDKERLPTIVTAGLLFKASAAMIVAVEIEKDIDYPALIKAGAEYVIHKKFAFRSGFNLHPSSGFFGFGYRVRRFAADYSMQYALVLGMHHQAGIIYQFKS